MIVALWLLYTLFGEVGGRVVRRGENFAAPLPLGYFSTLTMGYVNWYPKGKIMVIPWPSAFLSRSMIPSCLACWPGFWLSSIVPNFGLFRFFISSFIWLLLQQRSSTWDHVPLRHWLEMGKPVKFLNLHTDFLWICVWVYFFFFKMERACILFSEEFPAMKPN